ncbi:hypothetical protein ACOSQ2_020366 [Xanthoceras sorbifolium]
MRRYDDPGLQRRRPDSGEGHRVVEQTQERRGVSDEKELKEWESRFVASAPTGVARRPLRAHNGRELSERSGVDGLLLQRGGCENQRENNSGDTQVLRHKE